MTVASETNLITAIANGSQTVFPYTFRALASADLVVIGELPSGAETYYTEGTHYTVSGVGSYAGGNVTFGTAPSNGTRITIRRAISAITQTTDLRNQGAFFAETHEDVFDRLTMMIQTLKTDSSRSMRARVSDFAAGVSTELPNASGAQLLGWNAGGTALTNYSAAELNASTFSTESQIATASQTVFNLASLVYTPGTNNLAVYRNGLRLVRGDDYTETSSTRVTLSTGATAGDELLFVGARELNNAIGGESVQFLQEGIGAVARSIQEKAREIKSPEDYGGDIQAALNAVSALGGGAVELKSGKIYYPTTKINIPSNCGIIGDGTPTIYASATYFNNTSLLVRYTSTSAVIDLSGQTGSPFTPSKNPFIIGVKIESQLAQGRMVDAIICRNAINAQVQRCEIFGFPVGCGIRAASLVGANFSDNYIHDFLDNTTAWVGVPPLKPQSTAIEIDNDRINSIDSTGVRITNNEINKIEFGPAAIAAYGFETDGVNIANTQTFDYVINSNRINLVGEGIDTFGERGAIVGNAINNTYGFGIKLIHGASLNTVQSNVIRNTGIAGIVVAGSNIAGVGDATKNCIIGNIVENVDYLGVWSATGTAGIKIDNSSPSYTSRVTNNLFVGNSLDGSGKSGIITGTDPDKNVFVNNRITSQPSVSWVAGSETTPIYDAIRTGVRAGLSVAQSIPASTITKVQFNSEAFDIRSEYDNATNYRWTCQIPGIYSVKAQVRFNTIVAGSKVQMYLRKNASDFAYIQQTATGNDQTVFVDSNVQCAVGDYVEVFFWHNDTVARDLTGVATLTFMTITQA